VSGHHASDEFDVEPVPGLPEHLPEGEVMLWQGSPDWRSLARRAFHTRKIAVYFAILVMWRVSAGFYDGQSAAEVAAGAGLLAGLAAAAVGILSLLAWLNGRMTVFTITNRRVVMRFGVALSLAVNFPFRTVQSADLKAYADGTGDLPLDIKGAGKLGYLIMWPFARPWKFGANAQPMLRAVPEAERVAEILAEALTASTQEPARSPQAPDAVDVDDYEGLPRAAAAAS